MHSVDYLMNKIQDAFPEGEFLGVPIELYEPIEYTLSQGGKRLRPLLVLLSCDMFGGNPDVAMNPAIGVEIFHNFTLLHDDIMDQAPLRRGAQTVYKKWDSNVAILSGDTMFVMAYEYVCRVTPAKLPSVLATFNDTARKVCEGQQYDMNFETQQQVNLDDYFMMIQLKTAVLIACCVKVGAIMAGASAQDAENIYKFGENLGMAFQLQDDLLDAFGDTSKFGKEIGGDIVTNKKTFLYLKAFELANGETLEELTHLFHQQQIDPNHKILRIKEIYQSLGIDIITQEIIEDYHKKAIDYLNLISVEEASKRGLRKLANEMIHREV
ncbi:MAG: polyprenyl synthetase family protein [Bacteroidales bacterium]|nr:polyprenyl synthetase family protein [Bacteroidales bacterium]